MAEEKAAKAAVVLYAVVRVRGGASAIRETEDTAAKLRLVSVNSCTVVPSDGTHTGMLHMAADYLTWGEVSEDTLSRLIGKRGAMEDGSRPDGKQARSLASKVMKAGTLKGSGIKPMFRLAPPAGGLRSIRMHYPKGDLGYRGAEINKLLERMI